VLGTWAGLRPLVKNEKSVRTADLSRRHSVLISDGGLVTITGGKLTTYRKMAEDTVDTVVGRLGIKARKVRTKKLALRGAEGLAAVQEPEAAARLGIEQTVLDHLVARFGSEARTIAAMVEADPLLARPLVPGLPYIRAEAVFAARYEMARTLEDVLSRRTRALLLDAGATTVAAFDVARLLASELGWSEDDVARQVTTFLELAERERDTAGLPPIELAEAASNRG
jgi:glycerol-3-phosphate dehydrogenase